MASAFEQIVGWPYKLGQSGTNALRQIDCSGAFVRAYRLHNKVIYHGSNTIYRKYCGEGGLIGGDVSKLEIATAVFKHRLDGKEPAQYSRDGIGNLYHIGLVVSVNPLRIIHSTSPVAKVDFALGGWSRYRRLYEVDYFSLVQPPSGGGNVDPGAGLATVWATSGTTVKMRALPSRTCSLYWDVPVGAVVQLHNISDGWGKITHNRRIGYMMEQFLMSTAKSVA